MSLDYGYTETYFRIKKNVKSETLMLLILFLFEWFYGIFIPINTQDCIELFFIS